MRVAVLSDIHANLDALEAVLADLPSVDAVWQLGDVVGYGPEPNEVIARLRDLGSSGVRGNHDAAALGGSEIEAFNVDARRALEWTRTVLAREATDWLAALPETAELGEFTLVHGSPRNPIWEYVTSTPVARAGIAAMATPHGLHGHTHIPVAFSDEDGRVEMITPADGSRFALDGRRALLNPGSVGQPRDGIPSASWMLLDIALGSVTWRRTSYDVRPVQERMLAVGLPERLAVRLAYGL
jgi:diadenosine tetraphosphatase ApaH/serine/threonine PP2A family protein phosphatase